MGCVRCGCHVALVPLADESGLAWRPHSLSKHQHANHSTSCAPTFGPIPLPRYPTKLAFRSFVQLALPSCCQASAGISEQPPRWSSCSVSREVLRGRRHVKRVLVNSSSNAWHWAKAVSKTTAPLAPLESLWKHLRTAVVTWATCGLLLGHLSDRLRWTMHLT